MPYDFRKIKHGCGKPTFDRACEIYRNGGIVNPKRIADVLKATVAGNHRYDVLVSTEKFGYGECNCYLGQQGELCKHMVALSIFAVLDGRSLDSVDCKKLDTIQFCGDIRELSETELAQHKAVISDAMKLIKPYNGPSRIWFAYQDKLEEAASMLTEDMSQVPAGMSGTKLVINTLLRLDRKLRGVDDSNGIIGGCITDMVGLLLEFYEQDKECAKEFKKLLGIQTMFGWEEPLIKIIDEADYYG